MSFGAEKTLLWKKKTPPFLFSWRSIFFPPLYVKGEGIVFNDFLFAQIFERLSSLELFFPRAR